MKKLTLILFAILVFNASGCASLNNATNGAGLGALVGGLTGALTAKDKFLGATVGATGGAILGYIVGNEMDKYDMKQLLEVADTVPSGQSRKWKNPDNGKIFTATPKPAYTDQKTKLITRDVVIRTEDGTKVNATVYRDKAGNWCLS